MLEITTFNVEKTYYVLVQTKGHVSVCTINFKKKYKKKQKITKENFEEMIKFVSYNTWADDEYKGNFPVKVTFVADEPNFNIDLQADDSLCQNWIYMLPLMSAYNNMPIMETFKALYNMRHNNTNVKIKTENYREAKKRDFSVWNPVISSFALRLIDYVMRKMCGIEITDCREYFKDVLEIGTDVYNTRYSGKTVSLEQCTTDETYDDENPPAPLPAPYEKDVPPYMDGVFSEESTTDSEDLNW